MTRLNLFLCAEGVIVDQRSNNVSVFTILEDVTPEELPIVLAQFVVLAILERDEGDPEKCDCTLALSLNDEGMFEQDMVVDFQSKRRVRQMLHFGGVAIEKPGTLTASLEFGGEEAGEWHITVNPPKKPTVREQTSVV